MRRTYDVLIDEPMHVRDVPVNVAVTHFDGDGDWNGVHSVVRRTRGRLGRGGVGRAPATLASGRPCCAPRRPASSRRRCWPSALVDGDLPSRTGNLGNDESNT